MTFFDAPLEYTEASLKTAIEEGRLINWRGTSSQPTLPRISIGQPIWYDLRQLAAANEAQLPAELLLAKPAGDLYLIRMACTFRTDPNNTICWAQFNAYLNGGDGQPQPCILDIFPNHVEQQKKVQYNVSLLPKLELADGFELSLGGWSRMSEHEQTTTVVEASGLLESIGTWQFKPVDDRPISGAYLLHIIVAKPAEVASLTLDLELIADVQTKAGLLQARTRRSHQSLRVAICETVRPLVEST